MKALIAAVSVVALSVPAPGQTVPKNARKPEAAPAKEAIEPPKPQAAAPLAPLPPVNPVPLAEDWFRLNSVGLSMHLPGGAQVQTSGAGDLQTVQVMDKDQTWLINIRTPSTRNDRSAEKVATEVRDQLLAVAAPLEKNKDQPLKNGATTARLLQDISPLTVTTERPEEARPGCRFYVAIPQDEKGRAVVRGYTVFAVSPGRYATFELVTPEPTLTAGRAAYETALASVRFADTASLSAGRGTAVESGLALIGHLSPADYDGAIAVMKDRWFRLSRADKDGADQELAYRRVRAWKGKRGEIDPNRDAKKWSSEDHQEGYLVRIDARSLREGVVYDSVGTYFMSPDRRDEAWLLQMVIRDPSTRKPATWREVGARSGKSMSVATDGSGESKVAQPAVPDTGYLNQVEAFLLPQLVIPTRRDTPGAGEYGFYIYQSEFGNIRLRRDTFTPGADKTWTISTRVNEDREPQVSTYGDGAELVKTVLAEGGVWTPITLQRLAEIWAAKKLPMD
jgi:hypothetical protein